MTLTLPLVAATLDGSGLPWYAAHLAIIAEPDVRNVLWRPLPLLDTDGLRWARPDEVAREHIVLDQTVFAEILFASALNPAHATDEQIRTALHRELCDARCTLGRCVALLGQEGGDHPEVTAWRMTACRMRIEQLLGGAL